ncbi:MAG TPA: nucleotide exchange factor GrpE [Pyrinomonadaceae bacterium]|jgi:molecular chaperone GrpE
MNSKNNSQNAEELSSKDFEFDDSSSIDDFIKELEAKEKDLHISGEMIIEIDDNDYDKKDLPAFSKSEFSAEAAASKAIHLSGPASISGLETEVSTLQAQISKNETERSDLMKLMQSRQTDFENYKKRVERERNDTFLNILSGLANQMLPVLDNMNRALDSVSNLSDDSREQDVQHFFDGIVLVNQQLNEVLAEMGVEPIRAVGESFDPHFHEAVAAEETDECPPHTVTAEFLRGYRIGNKVVRPAMVKVSKS